MKRYVIRMKRSDTVFVLEDSEERMKWFRQRIPDLVWADTSEKAIDILKDREFDWVFLDHDLSLLDYAGHQTQFTGTGKDVAKFLSGFNWVGHNVVIHSWNPMGAAAMKDILNGAGACIPFGQFELEFS